MCAELDRKAFAHNAVRALSCPDRERGTDEMLARRKVMNKTFLVLLAGVAIGLLLAPEKGSETLKKVVDGFKSFGEDANFENFNNNYNKFWETIGGRQFNDYYLMECPLHQKPIMLITSKHRKRVLGKRRVLEEIYKDCYRNIKCFL